MIQKQISGPGSFIFLNQLSVDGAVSIWCEQFGSKVDEMLKVQRRTAGRSLSKTESKTQKCVFKC